MVSILTMPPTPTVDTNPRLDPLVHSLRWIRERPLDHAVLRIRRHRREHRGYWPARLILSHEMRQFLLLACYANGGYAVPLPTGDDEALTLFGVPIVVDSQAGGITPEGEDHYR